MAKKSNKDKEAESLLMKVITPSDQPKKPPQPILDGVRRSRNYLIGPGGNLVDYDQIIGPSPDRR